MNPEYKIRCGYDDRQFDGLKDFLIHFNKEHTIQGTIYKKLISYFGGNDEH